jgi:hypothetical protein
MNTIAFPLEQPMTGPQVADLQDTLRLLLDRGGMADTEDQRRLLADGLQRERAEQSYGIVTRELVSRFQRARGLSVAGAVDQPTAAALNQALHELNGAGAPSDYVVTGTVRLADGALADGLVISAFDQNLRSEQALGQSQIDERGVYQIRYSRDQVHKAEKRKANLVVKAFDGAGALLAAAPVLFNAPVVAQVDLTIPAREAAPASLFETIERALTPRLEQLKIAELEEDSAHQDLQFLSGETGFEKPVLARFVLAHRLAEQALPAPFWFALLGGARYAYSEGCSLAQQAATVLETLPSLDAAAVRTSLIRSFNQREIPDSFQASMDGWIAACLRFAADQMVRQSPRPSFVTAALVAAGIKDAAKQARFARLFHQHRALTPALLAELEQDSSLDERAIADLRTSFALAELTQSDFSVVDMLKGEFGLRRPEQIRKLAKQSETEWVSLITAKHAAGAITLPINVSDRAPQITLPHAEIYGKRLALQFREAFPTTAFAGGLERAAQHGGARGLRHPDAWRSFLDRHQDFELLHTPIDDFLENHLHSQLRALAADADFRRELKAAQRVFKLAPTFEAVDALLADDLHSAQQIYRLGQSEFVQRYADRAGFTAESARRAWNRAADAYAAALTVVADLKSLQAEALPLALHTDAQALTSFPNWDTLFATGDLCECEQCRSALSPAAYFADLLMFLKDRKAKDPARTVKDILFKRRPDLGFLELNCDNALTTLPYIDVVCEALEQAIAADEIELPGFTAMPADPAAAKAAVAGALAAQGIRLGAAFSLRQVNPADPDRWVAHGDDATCLLKKNATPNFFAERLRNTKASAAELRAYPQYVNAKAYAKLRAAKYPLALPFDLFAEEVRAALQKINLKRWDLMRTLRGATTPNNPSDGQIAAEYFGISSDPSAAFDEQRLILVADPTVAGQQLVWGETGNAAWLDAIGKVSTFLQKTGLEYHQLLALLDLKYINPAGDIAIEHLDASSDADKQIIRALDVHKLDRLHRFLRLWRKLQGWQLWELDLVIRHPRIGNGALDEGFVISLFFFSQLRQRLGPKATVEQVCALFGSLNTASHFTRLHQPREQALYHSLFLNKRLINPLDPAFQLDPATGDLPAGQTISAHQPAALAALGVRESDLSVLKALTRASNGAPYITNDLTLANLSFLWRHAWLARLLKLKAEEWTIALKLVRQDVADFASPQAAWEFIDHIDQLKAAGFTPDELNWLLAADRTARAAAKETDAARFLIGLRKDLQAIQAEYNPARYDVLTAVPPTDVERLTALLTTLLQKLNRDEATVQAFIAILRDELRQETIVPGLPPGFDFPSTIKDAILIRYDEPTRTLRFSGLMTEGQLTILRKDPALAAVTGIAAYAAAIEGFFVQPRLTLKFYDPLFSAPLASLPPEADFNALSDAALAQKIVYDAEQRLLRCAGILSNEHHAALAALSADPAYRAAVDSLAKQPWQIAPSDPRIWLLDGDLQLPLRDLDAPADNLAQNLATASLKALAYLSQTLSHAAVVQQSSAQLGLTEAMTRRLLTGYAVLPSTLLAHLTGPFAATTGVVDYASLKTTFDGWFWARRVATILKTWKLTQAEWEQIAGLAAAARLLDVQTLPLDSAGPIASLERFLRTSRLLRLRDSVPEDETTLLDVLTKLSAGRYATPADFAADVQRLNHAWPAHDVQALTAALDLAYPADYLLAESWERMRRAFSFGDALNAGGGALKTFAAAAMTEAHARTLNELLRSRFGTETWHTLSAAIQDVLRERKRDALAAYLLAQPAPGDAPSGKWENANDLYAYYLLDVEMAACQLTSRLVQASGSVQLFVQRCFMGLEPDVAVTADGDTGDSAWRWWTWMRKYRVWEANRKVFLWPENWIEPELKQDRSPFFKDLENELLQNEINQQTVETAFANYLDKLDGVAQLEIAGFYQEDDADAAMLHVFGRTPGAEPHRYYYRRYDYRQWTPWEQVDLDIQGEYLIPAVVNKRLFLFWPVFTEMPDDAANNAPVEIPAPGDRSAPVKPAVKRLRVQLAVSEYRQGAWTPKKVSKDFYQSSQATTVDIVHKFYRFFAIDRSAADGRFGIIFDGYSLGSNGVEQAGLQGAFEVAGAKGVPERASLPGNYQHALRPEWAAIGYSENTFYTSFSKWIELGAPDEFGQLVTRHDLPQNDFTIETIFGLSSESQRYTPVLQETPGLFSISPAWHLSYFDKLLLGSELTPVGTWLPFFYNDKKRTFFVLPARLNNDVRSYYPAIKNDYRQQEAYWEAEAQKFADAYDLAGMTPDERRALELELTHYFPEEAPPPYTDAQARQLIKTLVGLILQGFMGLQAQVEFRSRQFHFKNSYHPFARDFAKLVANPLKGIPALMRRETQLKNSGFNFRRYYQPTQAVVDPATESAYPAEIVDFTPAGAYAPYNWELFFHAPLLIANSLSKNQRFEEARDWYHFMFNPLGLESAAPGGSPMSKYWITKPFFETTDPQYVQQRIENILRMLAGDTDAPGSSEQARNDLEAQVRDWRTNPFEPHRIASYRTVAYQKTVVMKYLDNLIAWGDNLFRQDSAESINEATQLYILAAEILGPRPKNIPLRAKPPVESFNELENRFDAFSNALVEVENLIPPLPGTQQDGADGAPLPMLYFCIPHNDKLLGYWDTVADRLYKIRHCMNIEGVVRQLALFEPPIDPGALVKAMAAGVDISGALANVNAPLPFYRFDVVLAKAHEVCSDVKMLGGALLAALEKNDAEALSLLRHGQEIKLLEAAKAVRERQLDEAREYLAGLHKSKELTQIRKRYYASREFMNKGETLAIALSSASTAIDAAIASAYILSGGLKTLPQFLIGASGFGGSPHATAETGGRTFGEIAEDTAMTLSTISHALEKSASIASTLASYQRRKDEWDFQADLAAKEAEQIDTAIAAAELRIAMAEKELENHVLQIDNARAADAFMRSKYTSQELYQWQIGQLSGVYFQSYQLAYDLAKRAERCFRFELGLPDSSYIHFGYWDSLKKGLLAGEKLQYDLRRLETAYLDLNRRDYELTKHISLALLDPLALVKLRETGRCFFQLPEEIFDLDFPGHYFRRIKSVSLTLPCVVGPYTTVSCTLRLLKNSIRTTTADGDHGYPRNMDEQGLPAEDSRFVENNIPVKAIAVSSAQDDSGMFELSFRDERYLPFEGAGAVSSWALELFSDQPSNNPDPDNPDFGRPLRQFDYGSISDAILHVKYTAREDAGAFKNGAVAHLRDYFSQDDATPALRMFNLRQEFPSQWHRFLHPTNPAAGNIFELELAANLFPIRDAGKTLNITTIWLLARCTDAGSYTIALTPPLDGADTITLARSSQYGGLHINHKDVSADEIELALTNSPVTWKLHMTGPGGDNLTEDPTTGTMEVEDLMLVLGYVWQ